MSTRVFCLTAAWIWIAIVAALSIANIMDMSRSSYGNADLGFILGMLLGSSLLCLPSYILFRIARRIRLKKEKKERQSMLQAFDENSTIN